MKKDMLRGIIGLICAWGWIALAGAVDYPVYSPERGAEDVEDLKQSVSYVLGLSMEELREFVPELPGIHFVDCPNCEMGARGHEMFNWEPGMGDSIECKYCEMVFPNDQYPYNRKKEITAPSGKKQVYHYYEDENGLHYYLEANAWEQKWNYLRGVPLDLATLYYHTGEQDYADRAALIIGRYAQLFPDYPVRYDHSSRNVEFFPADQKWPYEGISPYRGGKWRWWGYNTVPTNMLLACDLLKGKNYDFSRMEPYLGKNIEDTIQNDFFRLAYEFVKANPEQYSNKSPEVYRDMIITGRVLGEPEMVHEGVKRFREFMDKRFFFDGWWKEGTPGYHRFAINNLRSVAEAAEGYSDPPDWSGGRFQNLDLLAESDIYRMARRIHDEAILPNGRRMPINDAWWHRRIDPQQRAISHLWNGLGHAILGAGEGDDQFQVHMNWSGNYGHSHMDNGSILLFAHEHELLSDVGYSHSRYRSWTKNSASHNVVVVDETSQRNGTMEDPATGNLLFFDDSHPNVQVLDVDASPAYDETSTYRRRLVHVHVGEGKDYVVDVFDVEGGRTHDYFLYGSADEQGELELSVETPESVDTLVPSWGGTEPYETENDIDLVGRKHHAYGFLRDVQQGSVRAPWTVTWRYETEGLRAHLFPQGELTVYKHESPSIRLSRDDDSKLEDYMRWGITQRRQDGPSHFAAVHEPFESEPWLSEVRYEDGVFTIARAGDGEQATDTIQWEGDRLIVESSEGWSADSGEPVQGEIVEVRRDGSFAFVLDEAPASIDFVRVTFGNGRSFGYRVESVEGNRLMLSHDPGFTYDAAAERAEFLYFPHGKFNGPLRYTYYQ